MPPLMRALLADDQGEDAPQCSRLPALQEKLGHVASISPGVPRHDRGALLSAARAAATRQELVRLEAPRRRHVFPPFATLGTCVTIIRVRLRLGGVVWV